MAYYTREQKEKDKALVQMHTDFSPGLQVLYRTALDCFRTPIDPMAGAPTRNWPPLVPRPNFAGVLFEQKAGRNRGIRRGQRGNQEFHWFKVGCLGPKPPHVGC